ncbi:hypothetical protein [Paenibacillus hexagrammi]|uniref:Uncharacterized protein n=1 Tax=Paenibacillus hexagrammi TaxID=2908839 RepID=A0ABY3SR67_9BACL|nr:hypothetical protein [Paenibacillus sp. YPD9-1]UJF36050.1 hypothetical protein L0M14_13815 [Paenibacillus sp. YPD9-1]
MTEKNENQQNELQSIELTDLPEEVSKEQLEEVKGGDWMIGRKPPIGKKPINP